MTKKYNLLCARERESVGKALGRLRVFHKLYGERKMPEKTFEVSGNIFHVVSAVYFKNIRAELEKYFEKLEKYFESLKLSRSFKYFQEL